MICWCGCILLCDNDQDSNQEWSTDRVQCGPSGFNTINQIFNALYQPYLALASKCSADGSRTCGTGTLALTQKELCQIGRELGREAKHSLSAAKFATAPHKVRGRKRLIWSHWQFNLEIWHHCYCIRAEECTFLLLWNFILIWQRACGKSIW